MSRDKRMILLLARHRDSLNGPRSDMGRPVRRQGKSCIWGDEGRGKRRRRPHSHVSLVEMYIGYIGGVKCNELLVSINNRHLIGVK